MVELIMLRAQADRAGSPALVILLDVITADLCVRGYAGPTERRLLLRGLALCDGRLAGLWQRAVVAVDELVQPVKLREAA